MPSEFTCPECGNPTGPDGWCPDCGDGIVPDPDAFDDEGSAPVGAEEER